MRRHGVLGVVAALVAAAAIPALVHAQGGPIQVDGHYAAAADEFQFGGTRPTSRGDAANAPMGLETANTQGNLWDNGINDLVNGLASERRTFTTATGGPEGDHISTIADDFNVPGRLSGGPTFELDEIRACHFANPTEAGMWIYNDGGTTPTL